MQRIINPPNSLTILRILLTPVFVVCFLSTDPQVRQLSLAIFFVAILTDWYDGWVARRWGYVTRWGTFLDPFADKVIVSAALFAFAVLQLVPFWTVWVIVVRDAVVTFLRTYAEVKGRRFDTSKFAKTKTFLQYTAIFYILLLFVGLEVDFIRTRYEDLIHILLNPRWLNGLMSVVAAITAFTGIAYLFDNKETVEQLFGFSVKTKSVNGKNGKPVPNMFIRLFGSALFTGYVPLASGTVGSALAVALYFIPGFEGPYIIMPAMVLAFLAGVKAGDVMEACYGHDPAEVTIDEVVGMWLALFLLPKSLFVAAVAFVLFRAFDIFKPFPAKMFDRQSGGFGIMMDDVVAGFYANIATHALIAIPYFKQFV